MKKIIFLLPAFAFIMVGLPAFSQTYKTVADTAALNTEYLKVSSQAADLSAKLNKAQNDLANYTKKANDANSDAQNAAMKTSDKASASTNGSVKDARRAKRQARRSVRDAKDSRKASNNLDDQNKKIANLTSDLAKKQDRLKALDAMRASINTAPQQ